MEPLISVIVPVYKVEKYLEKCIDSILAQTYKNLEIILVDDGSPDRCGQICDEYAKKDGRVKVIHKENEGVSVARNTGIELSNGELLCIIDSDDYMEYDMIEVLYRAIEENSTDMSFCGVRRVDENYETIKTESFCEDGTIFDNDGLLKIAFEDSMPAFIWNRIIRRECWNEVWFLPDIRWEDMEIFPRLMSKVQNAVYVDKALYNYYCRRSDSVSNNIELREYRAYHIANAFYLRLLYAQRNYPFYTDVCVEKLITHGLSLISIEGDKYKNAEKIRVLIKEVKMGKVLSGKCGRKTKLKFLLFRCNKRLYKFLKKMIEA